MSGTTIEDRAAFHFIRYASVWEDADILCEALAPAVRAAATPEDDGAGPAAGGRPGPGGRVLSVASAGDNALALLTLDPAEVVAVDLSEAQLAATAIRVEAFRNLDRDELLAFLGVTEPGDGSSAGEPLPGGVAPTAPRSAAGSWRLAMYRRIRDGLPAHARDFWDASPDAVEGGVIHAGRFERYFRLFRRRVLPLVHSERRIERLLASRSLAEQERFYTDEWDTWRWRLVFRLFFGRFVMGRLGRDPAFFEHVEGTVGDRILARTRHALTAIPVRSNPYLTYIMTGNYAAHALPRYLRAEHFDAIRQRLDRLTLLEARAEEAEGEFVAFNLSDIFEYMDEAQHHATYTALVERARPGARLAYWNMLAPRGPAPSAADRVRPLTRLAEDLHAGDKAWFYSAFHVDEVVA